MSRPNASAFRGYADGILYPEGDYATSQPCYEEEYSLNSFRHEAAKAEQAWQAVGSRVLALTDAYPPHKYSRLVRGERNITGIQYTAAVAIPSNERREVGVHFRLSMYPDAFRPAWTVNGTKRQIAEHLGNNISHLWVQMAPIVESNVGARSLRLSQSGMPGNLSGSSLDKISLTEIEIYQRHLQDVVDTTTDLADVLGQDINWERGDKEYAPAPPFRKK